MRTSFSLWIAVGLILSGAAQAASKPRDRSLKLTSINIRFDGTAFGRSDGDDDWKLRKKFLSQVVSENRPSIIGTQEGARAQLEELRRLLGNYRMVDRHRNWSEVFYPTLFFDPGRVEVLASGDKWLSGTPDEIKSKLPGSAWPRLFTWARIRHRGCGTRYLVVNTHLDNEKTEIRKEQVRILIEQVNALRSQKPDEELILLGDFNEAAGREVHQAILSGVSGIVDPWNQLKLSEKSSYNGFNGKHFDAGASGRIDWILIDARLTRYLIQIDDQYRLHPKTGRVQYPSDHNPVKLTAQVCE